MKGTNGPPAFPPLTAQVGEVVNKPLRLPNVSVPHCDPRSQIRHTGPYMFPSHVTKTQVTRNPTEMESWPSETHPRTPTLNHAKGDIFNLPTPTSPVPTPPMDHATTPPSPPTFAAPQPGGPPMWNAAPFPGTATYPSAPSTGPTTCPPTFSMPHYVGGPSFFHPVVSAPAMSHAQEELLGVSSCRLAREMMTSNRPPKEKRFSGDDRSIDFDSYMCEFKRVIADEHITDQMKWQTPEVSTVCFVSRTHLHES